MDLLKGFVVICKANELKGRLSELLEGGQATVNIENSYDFYAELEYEKNIGTCSECNERITTSEAAYKFEDDLIHEDCLYNYMKKFKL